MTRKCTEKTIGNLYNTLNITYTTLLFDYEELPSQFCISFLVTESEEKTLILKENVEKSAEQTSP